MPTGWPHAPALIPAPESLGAQRRLRAAEQALLCRALNTGHPALCQALPGTSSGPRIVTSPLGPSPPQQDPSPDTWGLPNVPSIR